VKSMCVILSLLIVSGGGLVLHAFAWTGRWLGWVREEYLVSAAYDARQYWHRDKGKERKGKGYMIQEKGGRGALHSLHSLAFGL
jgi:polyferredoxin